MRSQESNYMYSSFTKSTIKNQNTQLTEKSVGITIRMFPDYPIEKSQYPINKKISGYYPIHQNFLSGALYSHRQCCIPSFFQGHPSIASGEVYFFKVITIYGHGGHVGHVTQLICINFHFYSPSSFHINFGSKSPDCFCEKQVLTLKSDRPLTKVKEWP